MSGRMRQAAKMEQVMPTYKITEADDRTTLEQLVRLAIQEGYVPLGGVQVVREGGLGLITDKPRFRFFQTLVL